MDLDDIRPDMSRSEARAVALEILRIIHNDQMPPKFRVKEGEPIPVLSNKDRRYVASYWLNAAKRMRKRDDRAAELQLQIDQLRRKRDRVLTPQLKSLH